jgi:hypothetical protein
LKITHSAAFVRRRICESSPEEAGRCFCKGRRNMN